MHHFALRFADSHSAAAYPLPVAGPLPLRRRNGRLTAVIPLPRVPSGWIIAASFVTPGGETPPWQMRLLTSSHTWPLLPVPSKQGERPDRTAADPAVSVHIDCWHVHAQLGDAVVELDVEAGDIPDRHLCCLSGRPIAIEPPPPAVQRLTAAVPQQISQMTAHESIRHQICSPTSVAMLLADADRDALVAQIRDAATGLHGSWPMAVRAAARHGATAGVELHADWSEASQVLRCGLPFAASIRFGDGELPGAPLPQTSGHLVIVHGVDGDSVLVHDPAAVDDAGVPRRYGAAAFSRAWLAMRGASYIIAP